jgi:hypothetical protein
MGEPTRNRLGLRDGFYDLGVMRLARFLAKLRRQQNYDPRRALGSKLPVVEMRQALARRRGAAAPANLLLPVTRGAEFQLLDSIMTVLLVAISCWLLPALALAADGQSSGPCVLIFIAQLIALLFCGRLMGELMQRIGQPAVMAN